MNIVQPTPDFIPAIIKLFAACTRHMQAQGIDQWGEFYPTKKIIETDIQTQTLFAAIDNDTLLGVINISENQEEQYKSIDWSDNSDKILVIHRLAVHPEYQKQSIARKLMDYAENYGIESGYTSVRLDAYSINKRVLKFYENRAYIIRGEVFFLNRDAPFYCYEKIL